MVTTIVIRLFIAPTSRCVIFLQTRTLPIDVNNFMFTFCKLLNTLQHSFKQHFLSGFPMIAFAFEPFYIEPMRTLQMRR